jgi:hypothetical protein
MTGPARTHLGGRPKADAPVDVVALVKARCAREGECWVWVQATSSNGTPYASINGRAVGLRRAVYPATRKQPLGSRVVTMRCRNRACLNPEHMTMRTRSEVVQENADRSTPQARAGRVAANRKAAPKLTMDKAREIRALAETETTAALARRYGVCRSMVRLVVLGRVWVEAVVPQSSIFAMGAAA